MFSSDYKSDINSFVVGLENMFWKVKGQYMAIVDISTVFPFYIYIC